MNQNDFFQNCSYKYILLRTSDLGRYFNVRFGSVGETLQSAEIMIVSFKTQYFNANNIQFSYPI